MRAALQAQGYVIIDGEAPQTAEATLDLFVEQPGRSGSGRGRERAASGRYRPASPHPASARGRHRLRRRGRLSGCIAS